MQIHPLVTVKKASAVLGIDRNTLRERLGSGEMKGEKRRVGEKEKWFIYHEEIENWLEKQRLPELTEQSDRLSTEGLSEIFDEVEENVVDETVYITESMHREDLLLTQIVDQFANRLAQEQSKQIKLEMALQAQTKLEKQVKELSNKLAVAELLRKGQSIEIASLTAKLESTQIALEKAERPLWRRLFA
ncbi:MAG: helix-turn-helix domain-containing protein [Candidatus Obscuribacterales bacterium]|nr:helix-turn-helix domain-containing protein [Candidatus Obscuribacterales bacterium]